MAGDLKYKTAGGHLVYGSTGHLVYQCTPECAGACNAGTTRAIVKVTTGLIVLAGTCLTTDCTSLNNATFSLAQDVSNFCLWTLDVTFGGLHVPFAADPGLRNEHCRVPDRLP